jgi:PAS domain S-box-containing protein
MTLKQIQVLLLEDEASHVEAIRRGLESSDSTFHLQVVDTLKKYREYVAANPPDIALLDMVLPDGNSIDLLKSLPESNAFPILILTSHGNENAAVEALKAGALDYIVKSPETFADISRILTRNLKQWSLIQENKKATAALRASEANFHNSMENSPLGIRIVSEVGETLYTNRAFLDIYGYESMEEFNTTPVKDRYTPDSYVEFRERRDQRRRRETLPDNYEVSIVRKNGAIRHLQVMRKEILWAGKQQYQTIYQDITEHKKAEDALRLSETYLRATLDSTGDGILVVDNRQTIITTNNQFIEMFNVPRDWIIQKNDSPVLGHVTSLMVEPEAFLSKVIKLYASAQIDRDVLHLKDGRIVERYSEPLMLHNQVSGRVWSFRDFTDLRKAQEALHTSEERYRLIVEKSNDIIFTFSIAQELTYVSPSIQNALGYNPSDLIGRSLISLVHPEEVLQLQQAIRRNVKDGSQTPGGNELRLRHASGEWRWHNASGNAVYDTGGKFINFVGISRDITERKVMTMRLDELHKTMQLVAEINELIVKIDNEKEMLQQACNRFVESRQYPLAWIGFKKEGSFDILPFVQCGERADYLAAVNITRDDSPFGSGPIGIAVKTGKPDVIQDMVHDLRYGQWKESALKHGFKASAAFPLIIQDKVIGVLTIYSASAEAFNKDEVSLLEELAGDLSLGIEKIRRREAQLKLEEDLKLSEQNFRNSLDSSVMGIRIVDSGWHTLYANQVFLDMFGYKNIYQVARYALQNRYTPEEHARSLERTERKRRGESVPDAPKVDIIGNNGKILNIEVFASEVLWDGKKQRQLVYYDVTARQQAEEALKISEQNFRNSIDHSTIGIRIVDTAWHTLYANKVFLDIFGYKTIDEIGLINPRELYTDREYALFLERHKKRQRGESVSDDIEMEIIRKDGAIRHVQSSRSDVLWNSLPAYQLFYIDVTERVQAEEALKLSEQNFRNSLNSSLIGIRIVDEDGRNLYLNQTFLNLFGYENAAEVEASPPQQHYTPECYAEYISRGERIEHGEQIPEYYEIDIIRKDGAIRHLQLFRKEVLWNGKKEWQILYNDITERVQAEAALKISEQNFRNSIDSSTMGIRIMGDVDQTLYANQALLDIFGYVNSDELRKSPPQQHYTPESHAGFLQRQAQFANGETLTDQFEFDIIRKDGVLRHLQLSSRQIIWNGRQQYQILYNDITERVQAEADLKISEQNFRNSMDKSSIGIRISNNNDDNLYANQALLDIFGYKNFAQIQDNPPQNFYTPECYAGFLVRHEKFLRGEPMPKQIESDIQREDGTIRNLQVSMMDVFWDGKKQHQTLYNDITERKQAEEALKLSEQNFRNTLDSSLTGIFIGDSRNVLDSRHVLYINQAFLEMFGYNNIDEVKVKGPLEFYAPESHNGYLERLERRQKGEPYPEMFEIDIIRKDGSGRRLQVFNKDVLWDGQLRSELIYNDVTALKQAEEERQKFEDKAQVASRLAVVGEMAAGVAHEINNPLTGVLGFSQMLLEKENVPEEIKAELRLIVDGSQRVADIVKRLLTFARQTKPVKTLTNINELIDNTLKLREYVLKTVNINVVTRFDPELPWSVADPGQLQQVFLNLIVNAEQAIKVAHGRGTLTITTEKEGNNILMSFRDDGPGIKPENLKRLFEPFFTTKAPGEGTGLGLSLSRSIILEHNGSMRVESEFGRGANFIIELPIIESLPLETDVPVPPVQSKPAETKHGKILVVDDEPGVRILLERVFTQMGHQVDTVADAETAVNKLDAGSTYDIILTDVRMPGMSGIELHTHILEKSPAMKNKIIFITGDVMGADIKEFLMKNNLTSFAKPFDIDALKAKINSLMLSVPPSNSSANRSSI